MNNKADIQYNSLEFLQLYWLILKALALASPFLAVATVFFTQALAGAPEPGWWIALERAIGITW